jgi:hypothetical protein
MQSTSRILPLVAALIATSAAMTNASADMMMPTDSQIVLQNAVPQSVINDAVNQGINNAVQNTISSLSSAISNSIIPTPQQLPPAPAIPASPASTPQPEPQPTADQKKQASDAPQAVGQQADPSTSRQASSQVSSIIGNRISSVVGSIESRSNLPGPMSSSPFGSPTTFPPTLRDGSVNVSSLRAEQTLANFASASPGQTTFYLNATQANGQPLPAWLHSFDPSTGKFFGSPPKNISEVVAIRVTKVFNTGQQASLTVVVKAENGSVVLVSAQDPRE